LSFLLSLALFAACVSFDNGPPLVYIRKAVIPQQ
jgi:hypothetical protein